MSDDGARLLRDRVSAVFHDPKYGHDPGWLRINVLGVIASWHREQASRTLVVADVGAITDEMADAAQNAMHDFALGPEVPPLTRRQLGVTRQGWKVAIAAARMTP